MFERQPFIHDFSTTKPLKSARNPKLEIYLYVSVLINLIFAVGNIWSLNRTGPKESIIPDFVYSPVLDILENQNVVFTTGFNDGRTAYMGPPTPEREALWNDLYGFGTSMINRDQAAKLVNKTVPVPNAFGDYDGTYVVMLGVFHQLHCVNLLRKSLYKDKPWPTDPDDPFSLMHLEHCIDALRQAVMCSADVTPHPELAASSADDLRNQCGRGDICNAAFFIPAYPSEGLLVNAAAAEVDDIARHLFTIV
ncbi:Cyclochlorotine biosynthesis protein O [Colletotrichum orbiculare MAFF 240422]|uniref:Cyclochlorotine biosynthesis protein O n=1 Tax=Colletotrichum orbiculare (strain 104-T / ATCC 96160 / CBS 514.97 / LARS 414 / MAFF 240422) TaxID=1213857 RepID=A0A484FKX9_COLOR|nr:Cyclochlorotine biosynthesis protein O [Colletotrichum orbiculare MAFF 240422]